MKERFFNETVPFVLKRLDNVAKENEGHLALKKASINKPL